MKNNKGITLMSLVITIIILLILASITTYSGISIVRYAKFVNAKSQMEIMVSQLDIWYQEFNNGNTEVVNYGETINASDYNDAFTAAGIENTTSYKLFSGNYIESLGIDGIDYDFLIDIANRKIILAEGVIYENKTYYTPEDFEISMVNTELEPILNIENIADKNYNITLNVVNGNSRQYTYTIYINGEIYQTDTAKTEKIDIGQFETYFDIGIYDAYAEIAYTDLLNEEKNIESNHITGIEDYMIKYPEELASLSENVNGTNGNSSKNYEGITITQIADIDLKDICSETSGKSWSPIGTDINIDFKGVYDGQSYEISNLYINTSNIFGGLFGGNSGTIKNLKVVNANIICSSYTGGIVGGNSGLIENCEISNSKIICSGTQNGGIVGINAAGGIINNCTNFADVSGKNHIGGISGNNYQNSQILNCNNWGNISGENWVGGISGRNDEGSLIETSKNNGSISATGVLSTTGDGIIYAEAGGICGYQTNNSTISLCQNSGNISVSNNASNIGGIVGTNYSSTIEKSCNTVDINSTANYNTGGICGYTQNNSYIKECYNTGMIIGINQISGISGYVDSTYIENCYNLADISNSASNGEIVSGIGNIRTGIIKNCYNIGNITTGSVYAGGISAINTTDLSNIQISNCYYLNTINVKGINNQEVSGMAEGKTSDDMKLATFVQLLNNENTDIWVQDTNNVNNGYPILSWQLEE